MTNKMFKIKRVEAGEENVFRIATPDGTIEIRGTDDFVVRMMKSLSEESTAYLEIVRENFAGETRESIAAKMRDAGFPENLVTEFERGEFWDDLICD